MGLRDRANSLAIIRNLRHHHARAAPQDLPTPRRHPVPANLPRARAIAIPLIK